jgi:hypothetical protein
VDYAREAFLRNPRRSTNQACCQIIKLATHNSEHNSTEAFLIEKLRVSTAATCHTVHFAVTFSLQIRRWTFAARIISSIYVILHLQQNINRDNLRTWESHTSYEVQSSSGLSLFAESIVAHWRNCPCLHWEMVPKECCTSQAGLAWPYSRDVSHLWGDHQ